jgi:hypothetical protein
MKKVDIFKTQTQEKKKETADEEPLKREGNEKNDIPIINVEER